MQSLSPNMTVRYKADPSTVGWVIEILGDNARVFIGNSPKLVPTAELEPIPPLTEMSPTDFRIAMTRRRLEHPLTDQLLSYKASKTDLYYHQFLPVKKMLESPDQRILIADEVGTGKTIEAGLIWAELESRAAHGLDNVWIICPKSLVGKWQDEMLQRFDFRLEMLSSEGLRQALVSVERDGVLPPRFAKSVVNVELIRAEEHLARLGEASIAWDLVIFDEAHHLRNPDTLSYQLAQLVCERSKSAVFLTATPLQTSLADIVHLMQALGVDVAEDPSLLEEQIRWDMTLNDDWIRPLRRQPPGWQQKVNLDLALRRLEAGGGRERPGWGGFRELATQSKLDDRGQRAVAIQAALDLQVLSPYMTKTLRSDVDENRPTREAITRTVQFSPEEQALYNEVYRVCLERAQERNIPPGFVTQMPERRTASCVPAVASEILRQSTEDEDEEHRAGFKQEELAALKPFAQAALRSRDHKLEALCEMLKRAFDDLETDRVMVFSTFQGTLHYLARELRLRGYSLELMYGPTPARDEDCRPGQKSRERIGAEFRCGEFQILLASEVAGEGLDFEHCHFLVNYDLPWNPMRVEQRIGRCDRIGQRSDKVYVGNLASVGTIEGRILSRLYERLNIFERALGDMEVILGEQIASFERDVFTSGLSPQQQEDRLERISQVIETREQQRESVTQSSVISQQGRQLIESDQQEIRESESSFLSPLEIAEFVYASLEGHIPNSVRRESKSKDGQFEIRGTVELRDALTGLLRTYPSSSHARTEIVQFRNRTDPRKPTKVSFSEHADDVEFVHIRHPLVLLARHAAREQPFDIPHCVGVLPMAMTAKPTMLVWAIGSLEGYTNRAELFCAAVDCDTGSVGSIPVREAHEWMRALAPPQDLPPDLGSDAEVLRAKAEQTLLSQFERLAKTFNSKNDALTKKARQAVKSLAEGKLARSRRQLSRNDIPPSIRNLHLGWIRNIEADTQSKLDEIERKSEVRSSLQVIGVAVIHPIS